MLPLVLYVAGSWLPLRQSLPVVRPDPLHKNLAVEDRMDTYWKRALQEVYRSSDELKAQRKREVQNGRILPLLVEGSRRSRDIALTFDDGPHADYTPLLLAALKKEEIKATFFVVGSQVEKHPELIKAEDANGHLIANHTFSHVTLTKIPIEEIRTEYRACSDLIEKIIGKRPRFCRPPGGDYDEDVVKAATEEGLTTTLWTDDPGDFALPAEKVLEKRLESRLSRGGIILLHDGVRETIDLIPTIAKIIRRKGLKFVTLDELNVRP